MICSRHFSEVSANSVLRTVARAVDAPNGRLESCHCILGGLPVRCRSSIRWEYLNMSAMVLSLSHLSTKLFGIDRTVRMFHWVGEKTKATPRDINAHAIAGRALRGLDMLPMRIECLDQAIAVWFSLNRHGHPAALKIGMRLSPLSGHAWVTCGDEVFVTTPGMEDFTIVAAYDPWPDLKLQQSEPS